MNNGSKRKCYVCMVEFDCIDPIAQHRCITCQVKYRQSLTPEQLKDWAKNHLSYYVRNLYAGRYAGMKTKYTRIT